MPVSPTSSASRVSCGRRARWSSTATTFGYFGHRPERRVDVPLLVAGVGHYGRIERLLARSIPVRLEVNVETVITVERQRGINVLVDLPGTDPNTRDELFPHDPLDYYETCTHHTNMDTYEYLHENDLKQAAVVLALVVYGVAAHEMLPRQP